MNILGLVSGITLVLIGIFLIMIPFFVTNKVTFITWIYGIPLLIIGILILFNIEKEDKIEEVKYSKK